ncbi:MAG: hypothetical protein AB7I34_13055 [Rhizobiaceae bacterium]
MTTRKQDTGGFLRASGRSWEDWISFLDGIGAAELTHTEIARSIHGTGLANGWWSQGIAVAYEQHIGRRKPGQRSTGDFEASVTKTLVMTREQAYAAWLRLVEGGKTFGGVAPAGEPTTSLTPKRSYWRISLADSSRVVVAVEAKGVDKAMVALQHTKLASEDRIVHWRKVWKAEFEKL